MKVTVITAVRNGASMIGATLRSVSEQTYRNVEHIVIDGASQDGTMREVSLQGKHVDIVCSEPDNGVYDAFNKGLRRATGDVVAYLNAGDTYASREVIEEVTSVLVARRVDAVFGDVAITDGVGGASIRRFRSSSFSRARLAWGFMPAHPSLFLKRSVYESFGYYDDSYRNAGDFELAARVFGGGHATYEYLPKILANMPTGGLSNSGWRSVLTNTREIRRACEANGIRTNWAMLIARLPLKYGIEILGGS